MILSCPNCATKYTLNDSQLGERGRTVRCAACKTTWHAERPEKPAEKPIDLSFSDVKKTEKETVEDLHKVKAKKLPLKYRAILEDKKRMKALAAQGLVWSGMAGAFAVVLALGFFLRVDIVRAFPRVAGAYAMVGLPVNWSHMELSNQTAASGFKNGRFIVTIQTQVKNLSDKPVPVPPVRVRLFDASQQEFTSVLKTPNGLVVPPKATRTLTFDVDDPKNLTSSLDLKFDLVAMKDLKNVGARLRTGSGAEHDAGEHEAQAEPSHEEAAHGPAEPEAAPAHAEATPEAPSETTSGHTEPATESHGAAH
ncbi:MAG: zinc-ribbon domain-containing protein [Asticcacaulis sp.]|uniref:zinc-ribbon domain-containing protein n=1 Tax=Asticcacaulis sp. TaxID=1872648 RepID=UPI0039E5EB2C